MKTLDLTVLAHEGPQARAYLSRMHHSGFRPSRIVLMVQKRHPVTRKTVGRWLPKLMRIAYAEKTQDLAENYWPRQIRREQPELFATMREELSKILDAAPRILDDLLGAFRYELYCDRVDRILIDNLQDPTIADALAETPGAILFTGGGLLRANLLDLPGVRFLHVHPGYLPHIRGADGLLWSILIRHRPGASCFYMASGIDTGEVVAAEDFNPLGFDISHQERPDDQLLYRALLGYVDPLLRAELLVARVLNRDRDLDALPAIPQQESTGLTFHFLHPRLRAIALARVFRSDGKKPE